MSTSINRALQRLRIAGKEIQILAVSDDQPETEFAYRLWYDVYVGEKHYLLDNDVDHVTRQLRLPAVGALLFLALDGVNCIGSIRTLHYAVSKLEFEYPMEKLKWGPIEVTKFIVASPFRRTLISPLLMYHAQQVNKELYGCYTIVVNTTPAQLSFYSKMGFKKIFDEVVIHPKIGNKSYLIHCSVEEFDIACARFERLLEIDSIPPI